MARYYGRLFPIITASLLLVLRCGHASAADEPVTDNELLKFLREKVSFSGFAENATGLSVSHGSRFFNTSNRLDMQRFTLQPEFNVDMTGWAKFFISWRFVKEIRYSAEAKSRHSRPVSTFPPSPVEPLPNTYYDEDSFKPWEAVLDLRPHDQLKIRIGRQFISWGETDGIRLLDLINPQDLTFSPPVAPNLFNLDETRIPSWGLRAIYTVRPVSNTNLEFFAIPGFFDQPKQRVDEIVGANDTADFKVRYARWSAHPETRLLFLGRDAFANMFTNPFVCVGVSPTCVALPTTSREWPLAGDSWKIGTRISHTIDKLSFSLGYIWGYNPQSTDMVFKLTGRQLIQCPGTAPPVPPLCTQAFLRLTNAQSNIFAGQFNYPVGDVLGVPVNTTARGEMAFIPSKPYNISDFPGRNCATGALTGVAAGPHCKRGVQDSDGIVKKNTLRYAFGFDRTTLIPFLHPDDPWRAFNLSFQLFQSVILDNQKGIHPFFVMSQLKKISTTLTFRIGTGYLGDTILPDVFVAYDPEGYWSANPAISYVPPGNEKIKISLVGALYGGHNKFKSLGFFSEKDSLFLKLRYQF